MLLLTGVAGWILLAASPGELAGSPYAPQGHPPLSQAAPAVYYAPAYTGSVQPAGSPAPAWPQGTDAPRFEAAVGPAAHEQPVVPGPMPITPRSGQTSIPLAPPSGPNSPDAGASGAGPVSLVTVVASLGLVLGIFLLTAWGIRRAAPQGLQTLPKDAFEVLGRAPLSGRQQAHLLRLGNKLVLVSLTAAGAETLAEITDPIEVDRVAGLCREAQPGSATAVFRQVLGQFTAPRPASGSEDAPEPPDRYRTAERYHG